MPGLVDGFGDRLLMFDNSDTDPLELLRFHSALAEAPGFEEHLRRRVLQLRRFSDVAFPAVRTVERLEADGTLALVSTHTPGKRLSELLSEPRLRKGLHPAFVTWVLSRAIHPLSILQSEGDDVAHGALTADRLILTPGGRLSIVEHVLGAPLGLLRLPAARLWKEFGLMTPPAPDGVPKLDARADIFQLGVLAVSMLLARRITPADLNERLPMLLDECAELTSLHSPRSGDPLRIWLERALQIGDQSYGSAADAFADLRELPSHSETRAREYLQAPTGLLKSPSMLQLTAQANEQEAHMANGALWESQFGGSVRSPASSVVTNDPAAEVTESVGAFPMESAPETRSARLQGLHEIRPLETPASMLLAETRVPRRRGISMWIAVALGVIALAEAGVIAKLSLQVAPAATNAAAARDLSQPRGRIIASSDTESNGGLTAAGRPQAARPEGTAPPSAPGRAATEGDAALTLAAGRQRSGGVRLVAPIELKVLEGDRVLGSSADGPIVTTAGTHELDLVNAALGYRSRYAVAFRTGEITSLTVAVPNGRLSANAQPWAGVWVDGRALGDTPIANVDIPIGEHEVVFRHPQLGERRQTIVVRADAPTRVSATFDDQVTPR